MRLSFGELAAAFRIVKLESGPRQIYCDTDGIMICGFSSGYFSVIFAISPEAVERGDRGVYFLLEGRILLADTGART